MKEFWRYTMGRLAVFGVSWLVFWGLGRLIFEPSTLTTLIVLIVAMLVSAVVSAFLLAPWRDDLARNIQARAERMTQRLEESRSAEDID